MEHARITLHTVCGLEELPSHGTRGVTHVLSILDPGWPDPDFDGYGTHRRTVLRFHDAIVPGPGLVLPEPGDVETILDFGRSVAAEAGEAHILVHCHLGLSRSTAALATLFAQAEPEAPADALIGRLHALRDGAWPNARMIGFADEALGRNGTLVDAVRRLHGRQLARNPSLDAVMRGLNRTAEVEAAIKP